MGVFPGLFCKGGLRFGCSNGGVGITEISKTSVVIPGQMLSIVKDFSPTFFLCDRRASLTCQVAESNCGVVDVCSTRVVRLRKRDYDFDLGGAE